MWKKLSNNQDTKLTYSDELQAYDYILGEPIPSKPEYKHSDGGIIITVKVPLLFLDWKTIFKAQELPLFQIFRYMPNLNDNFELIHEEVIKIIDSGVNRIEANIYLNPGRYYLKLSNCKIASSPANSFISENSFIMLNDCYDQADIPAYHQNPSSSYCIGFYELNFRIRKADLYLGFKDNKLPNNLLLEGAFYHSVDKDGIVRTYIYHNNQQLIEGEKS